MKINSSVPTLPPSNNNKYFFQKGEDTPMARINGSVLGNLSGRLGNLSARTVQGETILGARPSNVNVSQSAAAVSVRNKFAVTTSFAKAVRSVADLSAIWEKAKAPKLSAHNTIFRQNFGYSETTGLQTRT